MPAARTVHRSRYQPDPALVSRAVDAIARSYQPSRIIVYGSFARGDTNELSDLDLIVIKQTREPFFDRIGRVREACARLPINVEPLVYTPEELADMSERGSDFLETVLAEGKVVYEASEDARSFLDGTTAIRQHTRAASNKRTLS